MEHTMKTTIGDGLEVVVAYDFMRGEDDTFDVLIRYYIDGKDIMIEGEADAYKPKDDDKIKEFTVTVRYPTQGDYEAILTTLTDSEITVHNVNLAPTANAGADQYVYSGVIVQLDGSESSDPDGDELNYHWIAPEEIVLSDTTIVNPTFTAPNVIGEVPFTIILIVDDGYLTSEPDEVVITVNGDVNVNETITPLATTLLGNYPNPFNPTTTIRFDIQDNETATLTIFNIKGQIVEQKIFSAGVHNHEWNAADISSGVYFYRLKSQTCLQVKKMILLK